MEAPTLTKKQKSRALSSKQKKKPSVNIKNVLVNSCTIPCPLISDDENAEFKHAFKELFPPLTVTKVKWADIKHMTKEKRIEYKKSLQEKHENAASLAHLTFGINETTRLVENNNCSLVLIATDANPELLVKHIIDTSIINNIVVLQVPDLRLTLKLSLGFSSVVIAFKNTLTEADCLFSVKQIFQYYCLSPSIHKGKKLKKKKVATVNENLVENTKINDVIRRDLYLFREPGSVKRCFIPNAESPLCAKLESTDYIYLGSDVNEALPEIANVYKPLKVKRVKPNPNRKRKFGAIKK